MNYSDFVKECMNLTTDGTQFGFWIENCIFKLKDADARNVAKRIDSSDLTMTMAGIKKCLAYIMEKEEKVKSSVNDLNFKKFKDNLIIIDKELQVVLKDNMSKNDSDPSTLFESYSKAIDDIKNQLDTLKKDVGTQTNSTDSKLFSTIINMVAILGIFVAIAFAGFGSVSVISKVEINMSEELLKSTFFMTFIALLIYNFILLLVYVILKVVNSNIPQDNYDYFRLSLFNNRASSDNIINKFLIVIDFILFVIVLALFICSLIF